MDVREKLAELQLQADISDNVSENTTQHREFTADFMMSNGVTVQEWISVKDRLPEKTGKVLVNVHGITTTAVLKNGLWHSSWNFEVITGDVTHWMPLPQPPKGE